MSISTAAFSNAIVNKHLFNNIAWIKQTTKKRTFELFRITRNAWRIEDALVSFLSLTLLRRPSRHRSF